MNTNQPHNDRMTETPALSVSNTTGIPKLEIRIVTDFSETASIGEEWNQLVKDSSSTVYQTYEWLSIWWEHFGTTRRNKLHVVLMYHGDRLVGIAPMFLKSLFLFRKPAYRCLCLLGSGNAFNRSFGIFLDDGPSDYLGIIAHPEYSNAVAQSLSAYFQTTSDSFDEIELLNLPEQSFTRTTLLPALETSGFSCNVTEADTCPRLTLRSTVQDFVSSLDASVRRRLQQAMKAAEERTLFSLHPPTSRADVIATLDELMILHQRRWRKMGYPGLFTKQEFVNFQFAITRAFLLQNWLYVKRAVAQKRTVAARLGFLFNGRFYDYLSGFDNDAPAAKRRPGLALLLSMMQEASEKEIREIDFLRGDEAYKFEFTSTSQTNVNVVAALPVSQRRSERLALALVRGAEFGMYLVEREWNLMNVQFQEHAFPNFIYHYFKFRTGRFFNKFLRTSAGTQSKVHTAHKSS